MYNPSPVPTREWSLALHTMKAAFPFDQNVRFVYCSLFTTIPMEKQTAHTDDRNETVVKKRGKSRSSKLSTKMTSMSRIEQRRERSEGGVIEKGEDLGDNETSLGFPPFW